MGRIMRLSLIYACLGMLSASAFAGCGFITRQSGYGTCNNCAASGMVPRNGIAVPPSPTPVSDTAASWSTQLPNRPLRIVEEPKGVLGFLTVEEPEPVVVAPAPASREEPIPVASPAPRELIELVAESRQEPKKGNSPAGAREIAPASLQGSHAADFKAVTGRVQMWRGAVRLRYAGVDQEDPYGGFVVLEGGAELTKMRDGQRVRVRGILIPPEDRNSEAHYRVEAIEQLD